MEIRLIRHATLTVTLAGKKLLVDPMFAAAGTMPPIPYAGDNRRNPLVELPEPVSGLIQGIDAVLVTHYHSDHWDDAAARALPHTVPILCQPRGAHRLKAAGFTAVRRVARAANLDEIVLIRTRGKHGTGLTGMLMGTVSGFVLRAPREPTVYIAGDTIWCGCVRHALATYSPDVLVVNAGAAQFRTGRPITMTAADIAAVCECAPWAEVVAVHMDTINHCRLSRERLRSDLQGRGLLHRVHIPADGETRRFTQKFS